MALAERAGSKYRLIVEIPSKLRALIRRDEFGLIGLGLFAGAAAGLFAAGILEGSRLLHYLCFGHRLLSNLTTLESPMQALAPVAGGAILGMTGIFIRKWRPRRPVDPIEANALHGGRMSVRDSVIITAQTIVSNGFGASLGLEAGYTQMGSGFASWIGQSFRLRRADLRMLVACGSAGAIGAAFGAPLTGAFYAYELILGTYTPFALAPVGAASVGGVLAARLLGSDGPFMGKVATPSALSESDMAMLLLLGVGCAGFGIAIMRTATFVETLFGLSRLPQAARPAVGGLFVGALAFFTPQVLGSGHSALFELLFGAGPPAVGAIAMVLILKSVASAISIGAGFRGGLFFASLFLGGLCGEFYASSLAAIAPSLAPDAWVCAVVGMAALAAAVVGGPLTMAFLALETTGDFPLGLMMLAVSTIVSLIVRRAFGYSFATWRLHLRGESIRSAQDVGWIRDLTVGRMMRSDLAETPSDMTVKQFAADFPLGSMQWVAATDHSRRYAGLISVPDAHVANAETDASKLPIASLARFPDRFLTQDMNIALAARLFEQNESDAFAVLDSEADRRVVGLLTEAHVLRRYADELDKARRELAGEGWSAGA